MKNKIHANFTLLEGGAELSSPHHGIALAVMLASWPTLRQWIRQWERRSQCNASHRKGHFLQAVLHGVPLTGLQVLRSDKVLLTLWKKGLEHLEKWSKLIAPSGAPPEEIYDFCDAHRTAKIACLVASNSLGIARFTSWVPKAHRIADLHRAIWRA